MGQRLQVTSSLSSFLPMYTNFPSFLLSSLVFPFHSSSLPPFRVLLHHHHHYHHHHHHHHYHYHHHPHYHQQLGLASRSPVLPNLSLTSGLLVSRGENVSCCARLLPLSPPLHLTIHPSLPSSLPLYCNNNNTTPLGYHESLDTLCFL